MIFSSPSMRFVMFLCKKRKRKHLTGNSASGIIPNRCAKQFDFVDCTHSELYLRRGECRDQNGVRDFIL